MSLLSICQRVVNGIGLDPVVTVASSSDVMPRQLLEHANATLEELCEKDWPILKVPASIDTINGTPDYALPADMLRIVPRSVWYTSDNDTLRGATTSGDGANPNETRYRSGHSFRLFKNPLRLVVKPTPDVVTTIPYEYITSKPVVHIDASTGEIFTADTDTCILPERLLRMGIKWRLKHANGLDYSEDYNKYQIAVKDMFADALALGTLPIALRGGSDLVDPTIPDNGYG